MENVKTTRPTRRSPGLSIGWTILVNTRLMRNNLHRPWKWRTSAIVIVAILIPALIISYLAPPRGEMEFDWKVFPDVMGMIIGLLLTKELIEVLWKRIRGNAKPAGE